MLYYLHQIVSISYPLNKKSIYDFNDKIITPYSIILQCRYNQNPLHKGSFGDIDHFTLIIDGFDYHLYTNGQLRSVNMIHSSPI